MSIPVVKLEAAIAKAVRNTLGLSDRPYKVEATISFTFIPVPRRIDLDVLKRLILMVDGEFPWKDECGADSIVALSDGETTTNRSQNPEQVCWFTFHPGVPHLKKAQLHGYEKYVANLVEKLAGTCKCSMVQGQVDVSRTFEFRNK